MKKLYKKKAKTLFDKIWDKHIVKNITWGSDVLYIDKHYIHEVTSPQAFLELKKKKIYVFRPKQTIATVDHNIPTINQHLPISEPLSKKQVETLSKNCKDNNITFYGLGHKYQGIVHVIGPELGLTIPGMTIVCGDSHTSTHGAFGCIAFGIGTSQVAMVLATQCLIEYKPKQMRIKISGSLKSSITPKDIILYIISKIGSDGGTGHFIEYTGKVFKEISMEGRMTICNMSIEMGARGGLIAPDEITFNYIKNKFFFKKKKINKNILSYWKTLKTDKNSFFDKKYEFKIKDIHPMITYGTNPSMGIKIYEKIPENNSYKIEKSLKYMGFKPGEYLIGKPIQYVFIGSCTNSRIEDIRSVVKIVKGKKKAKSVKVIVVPGSQQVYKQAKKEGLDKILINAGFDFRQPGCSACLAMNEDKIPSGKYCISTSNRNFEGRQGPGSRTILVSPITAAIFSIEGKIVDVEKYLLKNKSKFL